jgi:N-acyl-D-aspartate/D-glutamate deacylase
MLSRVEGMSADALMEAVTFAGGSFGDFLSGLEGRIAVNAGGNVGHCAVRRMVMGDDASERPATDAEVSAMVALVRAALQEGAIGFTSSQLDIHMAHDGRPVPSNLASPDELISLAGVLGEFDHGSIEFIPRTFLEGYSDDDRSLIKAMARASGKPVNLNTLTRMWNAPDGWKRSLEFAEAAGSEGLAVHPMFATNRQGAHFSLDTTFLFDELPSFRAALPLPSPQREERLRDPGVRAQMRTELADPSGRSFVFVWEVLRVERVRDAAHERWVGKSVTELAEEMATDPLDCFLDLSLAEDLTTQFVLQGPPDKKRTAATEELIRSSVVMAGSSDAGAHLLSFCGVDFTTRLLTEWVPDTLSFEAAVARLTSVPARVHGLEGRGVIAPGAAADLLVLDRTQLAVGDTRYVRDFPAASGRYVIDATGYVATIVNGEVVLDAGTPTGALPGHILRA